MTDLATEHHGAAVTERREVVVVGGGQAGLAIGYFLQQQGRDFTILEAAETTGAAWSERWDSLRLFTPGRRNGLPGRPFPGDPDRYPGRDEVVTYLTDYAREFELPLELDSRVRAVRPTDAGYRVELDDRALAAEQVVIATGPFQVPVVPAIAERLDPTITQFHSTAYRNPEQIPDGPVLVVGGGNTGYQIADELVRSHEVHLSVGARQTPLPQRILGPRPVHLPGGTGAHARRGELAAGQPPAAPRDADRLKPPCRPPPRHPAPRAHRPRLGPRGALRRRRHGQPRRRDLGHGLS